VELAKKAKIILLSENESNLYGESPENCLDVLETINSPYLKAVFDPANFILKGYKPFDRCWPLLKKYTVYFHIKDGKEGPGERIVPAGEGDGQLPEVLADAVASGFSGFASLEPHLSHGGQFSGFTGPDLFKTAIRALKKVLDKVGAKY
jgi:sugar phosphate isomerase/epimerase